jgi:two-component system, OmpR family, sensor kinase
MSLRLRLTLLYTTLLASVLLLFGGLVYGLASVNLYSKIDTSLNKAAGDLVKLLRLNINGQFDARSVANYQPTENLIIQVWGTDGRIQFARPTGIGTSMDSATRLHGITAIKTVAVGGQHLRVLTVPLYTTRGPAGTLQIAITLTILDEVQRTLSFILIILTGVAMVISMIATFLSTRQVLKPLDTMTNIATQITKADDLSRRIPTDRTREDEVGKLIAAFNQTLSRLDQLFTSQQRFLGDVSHELRTPLTVIKGNVGLMRRIGADEESMSNIEGEVDRLTRLVGDLLLINQTETGAMALNFSKVDLDVVLLDVFKQMKVIAGDRVSLKLEGLAPIQINGDKDRLKQVFFNLVGNALQYTSKGDEIRIIMQTGDKWVRICVKDNGPGISDEDLPHIFERFYRGEKSRKRTIGTGFGLGLSIAQWIVNQHGGTIEVFSKLKKGTEFIVQFPLFE